MRTVFTIMVFVCASLIVQSECALAEEGNGNSLGRTIDLDELALIDVHGNAVALAELADKPLVVVAFLGCECPLARLYAPRLAELHAEFASRGVAFVGVNSNRQDTLSDVEHFKRSHQLPFPIYKDPGQGAADQFGATRTPEVFLLDQDGAIRYQGRIDDQRGFDGPLAYQRPEPTRRDLAEALSDLLDGRAVRVPHTDAPGCLIARAAEPNPDSPVTWSSQIARIFQRRCQECHRPGEIGPFSLLTHDDVQGWEAMIAEVVRDGRMPPWHADPAHGTFANDARLSDDEKQQILTWIEHGAPLGDPAELPPPRAFPAGWQIPEPDQVIYIADEPVDIPAEGVVEYQWFFVDPGFDEDKWVIMAEARPGCREVVHHVTVYFKRPDVPWNLKHNDRINLLGGFNPGGGPWRLPDGMAVRVPAGSEIVFEMHYTPDGRPQQDRSAIGLVFAEPEDVRREAFCIMAANTEFQIPPHAESYPVESGYTLPTDCDLLVLRPHMHLRGKSFRYMASYPDGQAEILLDVPRYDFNWQHNYILAEPKRLPKGTRIECLAHFDNSADNPANPDPEATVAWGDQTWDEMMIGIVSISPVRQRLDHDSTTAAAATSNQWLVLVAGAVLVATLIGAVGLSRSRHRPAN